MSRTVAATQAARAGAARHAAIASLRNPLRAWRGLTWRHRAAAAGVGFACSAGQSLLYAARQWQRPDGYAKFDVFLSYATRWTPLLMIVAWLLLLGLALLEQRERGAAARPRRHVLLVLVIGAVSVLTVDPLVFVASEAINAALALPSPWDGFTSWLPVPLAVSLICAGSIYIMLSLWTLVYLYLRDARRTAQALAAAQMRRADAERRVLAEQLAGMQATVEPEFLFDTLKLTDELYEHDAARAQRTLDALIAYLRAALPSGDSDSTLGQQAELVRARLEIERIRLGGRLRFEIDVPDALAPCALAPLLLPPLAINAVRHAIGPAGGGEVTVRARQLEQRLVVEVSDNGAGRAGAIDEGAGSTGVRERLARLHGERARLVLADREPRGLTARLEIAEEPVA